MAPRADRGRRRALQGVAGLLVLVACYDWNPGSPAPADSAELDESQDDDDSAALPDDDDSVPPPDDDDTTPPADDDDTTPPPDDDDTTPPVQDCSPGPGIGNADECYDATSAYYIQVRDSVTGWMDAHPELVDWSDGNPFILDAEGYMNGVVASVNTYELCAIRDPNAGDEIAVKFNNDFAESFDILTWQGYARSGAGIYNATCAPAWF